MTKIELENRVAELEAEIESVKKTNYELGVDNESGKKRILELVEKIDSVSEIPQSDLPPVQGLFRDMSEFLKFLAYLKRCNNHFNIVTEEWLTDAVLDFPEAQKQYEDAVALENKTRDDAYAKADEENKALMAERKRKFDERETERRAKFHTNEL